MIHALMVFLGGGLGAVLRWGVGKWTLAWFGSGFPLGTMAVNIVGSLVIGLAIGALEGVGQPAKLFSSPACSKGSVRGVAACETAGRAAAGGGAAAGAVAD